MFILQRGLFHLLWTAWWKQKLYVLVQDKLCKEKSCAADFRVKRALLTSSQRPTSSGNNKILKAKVIALLHLSPSSFIHRKWPLLSKGYIWVLRGSPPPLVGQVWPVEESRAVSLGPQKRPPLLPDTDVPGGAARSGRPPPVTLGKRNRE